MLEQDRWKIHILAPRKRIRPLVVLHELARQIAETTGDGCADRKVR